MVVWSVEEYLAYRIPGVAHVSCVISSVKDPTDGQPAIIKRTVFHGLLNIRRLLNWDLSTLFHTRIHAMI